MSFIDAEFFIAVAFVLFVLGLAYIGAHKRVTGALDTRSQRIDGELREAKRLREEAAALLASFETKKVEAEKEADAIIAQAREDAERLARETEGRMNDFVTRRTKQAEQKIAFAEVQATAEVRAAAAEAAVRAAESVLRNEVKGPLGGELIGKGIADVKGRLH